FDIHINVKPSGRIVFKLYDSDVPRTARNFCELATGVSGTRGPSSTGLLRRGVPCRSFMLQRGLCSHNGMGGKGIYGETFA
ncbi:hypothetical protein DFH09DRAFT_867819, partial [Mycena vulgaris]